MESNPIHRFSRADQNATVEVCGRIARCRIIIEIPPTRVFEREIGGRETESAKHPRPPLRVGRARTLQERRDIWGGEWRNICHNASDAAAAVKPGPNL